MAPLPFSFRRECSMPNIARTCHPLDRASAEPIRTGHPRTACSPVFEVRPVALAPNTFASYDPLRSSLRMARMEYVKLGRTGLDVSRICLGCMTYGVPERGTHPWTLDEEASRPLIRKAVELGINFFDTANSYSDGTSEEIVGRALKDFGRRDELVIASKVFFPMRKAPNIGGLSRKAIFGEIDNSLRRLGTDYLDLYQIHRWD